MTDKVSSQGTLLKINTASSGSPVWTTVAGFKSISGVGGGSRTMNDVSDLSSTAKEKLPGLLDEGSAKISMDWVSNDAGQLAIQAARTSGALVSFELILTDSAEYAFNGYVQTFEPGPSTDKEITVDATVEITGRVTFTPATGD